MIVARHPWLVTVPVILLLGIASGWLSNSGYGNSWFAGLIKPAFMPPGWLFPVAWPTLYILMGVALARVVDVPGAGQRVALALFVAQLVVNLAWSPVFFGLHMPRAGLWLIGLLDVLVVLTIRRFFAVDAAAGLLLLPYGAWLALASALNWEIVRLNP
jgi:translocator protein